MQEQFFNGIRFTRTYDNAYFKNMKVTPHGMHRYIWEFYHGKIPEGYEIHHKDGNKANNDISNLECLEKHEHKRLHGRLLTEEQREWRRKNLEDNARPKASEWHKSAEGHAWHVKHAQEIAQIKYEVPCVCQQCGKNFITYNAMKTTKKFCSGACQQRWLRKQRQIADTPATCIICGKEFMTDKYHSSRTCSRSCRSVLIYQQRKRKGN